MPILIYIDHAEGKIKKSSMEAMSYGAAWAASINTSAEAIVLGKLSMEPADLGRYGITKVHHDNREGLESSDSQVQARIVAELARETGATGVLFSNNTNGKAIAPRVSVRLQAGLVTGVMGLPDTSNGFVVRKSVFSGKAYAHVAIKTPIRVLTIAPNSFSVQSSDGKAVVVPMNTVPADGKVKVAAVHKVSGQVPLSEAELVVSGGRGLKGPENWGMVEELAGLLGASTACSRPVADAHWRPHHEHVGQTGGTIAPLLYFAVGISGAIQHLAGVNRSKVIVVINKDPEAPFFKAADYGIVGDAFEVMPGIIEAVKKLKAS
jgi:electron transfer flavoprotein alpha subunit